MDTSNTAQKVTKEDGHPRKPEDITVLLRPNLSVEEKTELLDWMLNFIKPYLGYIPKWQFFGDYKFIGNDKLSIRKILDKIHTPHITTKIPRSNDYYDRPDEFRYEGYDNLNKAILLDGWWTVIESYDLLDSSDSHRQLGVCKIAGLVREGHLVLVEVAYDKCKLLPLDENSSCKWLIASSFFAENVKYFAEIDSLFSKILHQWVEARKDLPTCTF